MLRKLSAEECHAARTQGDFLPALRNSAPATAIILTQSWCPQWRFMKIYLKDVEAKANPPADEHRAAIFWMEYDREDWYEDFLAFKEDVLGNREVPYVRFYRDGVLTGESNYISAQGFLSRLAGPGPR
jgi:hypothetical protein